MGDDEYTYNIKHIDMASGFSEFDSAEQKKNRKKKRAPRVKSFDNLEAVKKCAANANAVLENNKSPYRFQVYMLDNMAYIDLVILDEQNRVNRTVRKNITNEEFMKIIEQIENLDGFFIDCKI